MAESITITGWERAALAAEKVKERLYRATAALARAGVPYAVIGGNAVAEWVGRVDEDAVRNTRDVDILLRRSDLEAAKAALAPAGFVYVHTFEVDMFLDGPHGRPTQAVHLIFADENVRTGDVAKTPDVDDADESGSFRVLSLEALLRMKLTSYRDKDKTHIRDLIGVGLIDHTWPARLPTELAVRLQSILDTPNG